MSSSGLTALLTITVGMVLLAYSKGGLKYVGTGFLEAGRLFLSVLPNLLIGFTVAGFLLLLLPQGVVARWLGAESGLKGILVGWVAGALTPGGPFTHFPILASLMAKGAALGPIVTYIASWALLGVQRIIVWEAPILGWRVVSIRVAASALFPPVIGLIAQEVAKGIRP